MSQYEVIGIVIGVVWFAFIALWALSSAGHEEPAAG